MFNMSNGESQVCAPVVQTPVCHLPSLLECLENHLILRRTKLATHWSQAASLANAVVAYCGNCDQLEVLGPTVAK